MIQQTAQSLQSGVASIPGIPGIPAIPALPVVPGIGGIPTPGQPIQSQQPTQGIVPPQQPVPVQQQQLPGLVQQPGHLQQAGGIPGIPGQQSQPIQAPQVVQGQLPPIQSHQSTRYSPQSNPGSYISGHQGRDSAPLVRDGSVLGAPVPVIQPVPAQDTHHQYSSSAPGVIQPRYTPGPDYSNLTSRAYIPLAAAASPYQHSMSYPHASYPTPSNYVAGKSLGSAPVYGAPPVYPQQPLHPSHSPYLYTHYPPGSNPTLPYPPGPMAPLPTPQPLPPTAFPPSSGYKV